jgi:hypothetical protein
VWPMVPRMLSNRLPIAILPSFFAQDGRAHQ